MLGVVAMAPCQWCGRSRHASGCSFGGAGAAHDGRAFGLWPRWPSVLDRRKGRPEPEHPQKHEASDQEPRDQARRHQGEAQGSARSFSDRRRRWPQLPKAAARKLVSDQSNEKPIGISPDVALTHAPARCPKHRCGGLRDQPAAGLERYFHPARCRAPDTSSAKPPAHDALLRCLHQVCNNERHKQAGHALEPARNNRRS